MIFYGTMDQLMSSWTYRGLREPSEQDMALLANNRLYAISSITPFYTLASTGTRETSIVVVSREVEGYKEDAIRESKLMRFGYIGVFQLSSDINVMWMENLDFLNLGLLFTKSEKGPDKFPCTNPTCRKRSHKSLQKAALCGGVYKFADKIREGVDNPEDWTMGSAGLTAKGALWQEHWKNKDGNDPENDYRCTFCFKRFSGVAAYHAASACYNSHFTKE